MTLPAVNNAIGNAAASGFSSTLLRWHRRHGRHDLPWQGAVGPYRIWVAEIMLQQTQVATVIPYFQRFVCSFPDIATLAAAPLDTVLEHWTGLGYYARARNLHRAAGVLERDHGGSIPRELDQLLTLPGIGRSTAGAILSFAFGQRQPVLDGNVKRVLARCFAVAGDSGMAPVNRKLWQLAGMILPSTGRRTASHNQAMMDLGAGVCTRTSPACGRCPLATRCYARALGRVQAYPGRRRRLTRPLRQTMLLLLIDPVGRVLLEQRPAAGIWGGLWSLPECPVDTSVREWCQKTYGVSGTVLAPWPSVRHGFTHFVLEIQPQPVRVSARATGGMQSDQRLWYKPGTMPGRGLAAPVKRLLQQLENLV